MEIIQSPGFDELGTFNLSPATFYLPLTYAGGIYDENTEFIRFGARDYDPTIGRWTAKDPILFAGKLSNLYEYNLNDPINYLDISGLQVTRGGSGNQSMPYNSQYYYNQGQTINSGASAAGFAAGATQNVIYNSNNWLGSNWRYNSSSWGGNQYTGARSAARSASRVAKIFGQGTFALNAAFSFYEGYTAYSVGDYYAVKKSGFELGLSAYATFGGVPGLVIGGSYFILDAAGAFNAAPYSSYYNFYPSTAPADNTYVNTNCN